MKVSRKRKINHFYTLCSVGDSVLDVGVSKELKWRLPSTNLFLKTYRYAPSTYTGLGVEDLKGMVNQFPGKRFIQYSGGVFPFPENAFEWVFSNAVIEHVGDHDAQLLFLNEMLRVGKRVFFTTPNKFFPFESHTLIFFIHWNDRLFRKWRNRKGLSYALTRIKLFSHRDLKELLIESHANTYSIFRNRFFSMPMTFTVICEAI